MNKKLTYFKISEPLLLFMWLVLSLLGFPIVNVGFFADPHNTVAGVIFYILISLIAAVAILNLIIGIKIIYDNVRDFQRCYDRLCMGRIYLGKL